jgi:hypothetical protein
MSDQADPPELSTPKPLQKQNKTNQRKTGLAMQSVPVVGKNGVAIKDVCMDLDSPMAPWGSVVRER